MLAIVNFILAAFLLVRLAINIEAKPLSVFFAVSYAVLFILLLLKANVFFVVLVAFLILDSLIGTYLFSRANNLGLEYWGTVAINVAAILLAFWRARLLTP